MVPQACALVDDAGPVDGFDQRGRCLGDVLDKRRRSWNAHDQLHVGERIGAGVDHRYSGDHTAGRPKCCARVDPNVEVEALRTRRRNNKAGGERKQGRHQNTQDEARAVRLGSSDQHQAISLCERAIQPIPIQGISTLVTGTRGSHDPDSATRWSTARSVVDRGQSTGSDSSLAVSLAVSSDGLSTGFSNEPPERSRCGPPKTSAASTIVYA